MRVLNGVVYETKRRVPRTEPWKHHKSMCERKRNYSDILHENDQTSKT